MIKADEEQNQSIPTVTVSKDNLLNAPSSKATDWDGSTVHVESAIAPDNPYREQNIQTIASRLARFNALESERDALYAALKPFAQLDTRIECTCERCQPIHAARAALSLIEEKK